MSSEYPPDVRRVADILRELGLRVYLIGARSLIVHGVDINRATKDWDLAIDVGFTRELRDEVTERLRREGFRVQWRKWGLLVEGEVHVDVNYAPLIVDEEFRARAREAGGLLVPSLEDIIVLKLMSGERKDIGDVKRIIAQRGGELDWEYLMRRARQAGLERELGKIAARMGVRLG